MRSMRCGHRSCVGAIFCWDGVARRGFERTTKSRAGCAGYRGLARIAGAVRAQQEAQGGGGMGDRSLGKCGGASYMYSLNSNQFNIFQMGSIEKPKI